jgi:ferredoxin
MAYMIDPSLCTACGACEFECPNSAISMSDLVYVIDATKCKECAGHHDSPRCAQVCPIDNCCVPAVAQAEKN